VPNGNDRNWVRLRGALEGFFATHGHWPSRVRLSCVILDNLRDDLFTPEAWKRVTTHLEFVADESAPIVAEDSDGNQYSYGRQGFPSRTPSVRAEEWLGAEPDTPHAHEA
jgi:hypothetical protein